MKKLYLLIAVLLPLSSCIWPNEPPPSYSAYRPVLLSRESLEKSVVFHAPEAIQSPAKIYFKDQFILISEQLKGVHIIDNSDPKNPVNKGYLSVPGCVDMAIKDHVLYVDNATDLVAVDLNSLSQTQVKITKRVREVFPELQTPDNLPLQVKYQQHNRPSNSVLVGWVK